MENKIKSRQINLISEYLNKLTYGLTLNELKNKILNKVAEPFYEYSSFIETLIKLSMEILDNENDIDVLINANITQDESDNVDNLETSKNLLHLFEEKYSFYKFYKDITL